MIADVDSREGERTREALVVGDEGAYMQGLFGGGWDGG